MQPQVTRMKDIDPCDASINTTEYFQYCLSTHMTMMIFVCVVYST